MANRPDSYPYQVRPTARAKDPLQQWSESIAQACEFFAARAGWVWLILSIGLVAGVLATT